MSQLDSSLDSISATDSLTVVNSMLVSDFDVEALQSEESAELSSVSVNSEPGGVTSMSASFIDSVPMTLSLQQVDGQHRIVCVAADGSGSTVSYVGQVNTNMNLELQEQVTTPSLQSGYPVQNLHPETQLIPIHSLNSSIQVVQNMQNEELGTNTSLAAETKSVSQKRKGGWPKGKKRKPTKEFSAPRAPTTGYAIFVNEKKLQLKEEHPDIPFTEITKMLGTQWSQLTQEEKQKYNNIAEKDKERYIEELKMYQNSEAYKSFLKRKALNKVKYLCGVETVEMDFENEVTALTQINGDENSDLYCRTCCQYFSSLHNKREHLLGKQHLQKMTEFEKETAAHSKDHQVEEVEYLEACDEDLDMTQLCNFLSKHSCASLDLCFIQELIVKQMKVREFEFGELNTSLEMSKQKHEKLKTELENLQQQKLNLETDLGRLKVFGQSLEAKLDNLKRVPMLLQFQIHIVDTEGSGFLQK
ncbi:uncharacterized protein LOC120527716 isoform X2 [Polypterus senegalus]|uniref:uncharacterized protein LOC120527716 isoform X2 n=1 Tax=Polypterus senegalus TaxID=55291 RepID=UPI001965C717|nr:uncharacterized protein LOC120527716 isoform X2 [Polypterus senegalus]